MITKTEDERIMLINTDITLRGYKYSKKKETDIHTDAHADGRKHTSMHTCIVLMFSLSQAHTHNTTPPQTVSYVSYLTRMNQFRNKDSGVNSVCISLTDFIIPDV